MLITENIARAIRRIQADKKLNSKQASKEIGITEATYQKLKYGGEVKTFVYQKAVEWLAENY